MRKLSLLFALCLASITYGAQQPVNVGTSANDHTGDPARTAFIKLNANDTELYGKFPVTVANGGTGVLTISGVLKGNGTSAFTAATVSDLLGLFTGSCTISVPLRGDGSCGTIPSSAVTGLAASATTDATNATNISSGTLGVPRGGTGVGTLTTHGLLLGEGTGNVSAVAALAADNLVLGQGVGADPLAVALTNCGDSTHALAYSTGTHTFSCQNVTGSGGSPASPTNSVQFNSAGSFGGDAGFTYVGSSTQTITLGTASVGETINTTAGTTNGTTLAIVGSQGAATTSTGGPISITGGAGGSTSGNAGGVTVKGGTSTSGAGGTAALTGGTSSTSVTGGTAAVTGGTGGTTGQGGPANLVGGAGGTTSGTGGTATVQGGTTTSGASGAINITTTNSVTSGNAGTVTVQTGNGAGSANGGNLTVNLGSGGGTSGTGGAFSVTAGTGGAGGGGNNGGGVTLTAGAAAAVAGSTGGAVSISAGAGTSTGTGAAGNSVTLAAGNAGGSGANAGGGVTIRAGNATGASSAGNLLLQGGTTGTAIGNGYESVTILGGQSSVAIKPGIGSNTDTASVFIAGGNAGIATVGGSDVLIRGGPPGGSGQVGGDVVLRTGGGAITSSNGNIIFGDYNTSNGQPGVIFTFNGNTGALGVNGATYGSTGNLLMSNSSTAAPSWTNTIPSVTTFPAIISGSTKFTTSGCSVSSTTGGAAAGVFTLGANSCTVVITINGATGATSNNGWTCQAHDRTAPATLIGGESSSTTTTASITIPAGAGATDVISFSCTGY